MTDRMLAAALAYAERLGWPVFPCAGKVPAIEGGRGCLDATTDTARSLLAATCRQLWPATTGCPSRADQSWRNHPVALA